MVIQQRIAPLRRSGALMPSTATLLRPIIASTLPHQAVRSYAALPRSKRATKVDENTVTISKAMGPQQRTHTASGALPLFPTTFVSLPLSQYPGPLGEKFSYQWQRIKAALQNTLSTLGTKLSSMPSWTKKPLYQAGRFSIVPTAKHMYIEMLEAYAAGDTDAIRRLCTPHFGSKLISAIEKRSSFEGTKFEVLGHTKGLFYPRLKSQMIHRYDPRDQESMTDQAVVAISSRQRTAKYKTSTGQEIAGSVKERDQVEYVVLTRMVNSTTWEKTDWKIWGTTSPTTLEAWNEQLAWINKSLQERAGWNKK